MAPAREPRVFWIAATAGAIAVVAAGAAAVWAQMATADRMAAPGFWPTTGRPARGEYVGTAACTPCHRAHGYTQAATNMALTAHRAESSEVLRASPSLRFQSGGYTYEIATAGGRSLYTVSDGTRTATVPLAWAFGIGKVGQTFLFEKEGTVREARVSYFEALRGLDFTPGRAVTSPRDLEEAMSRPVPEAEARRCFGCHTIASTAEGVFDPAGLTPGVTCESCHGPGRKHVDVVAAGRVQEAAATILNPGLLDPADSVDLCGACHATFWDVKLAGESGMAPLRSQPYRLQSSRCWGRGDERITCVACHDPHRQLERDPLAYDPRCLSCHVEAGGAVSRERPGRACPVARQSCTTCHMPKYEVADMHHAFTDHRIRVVEAKR